MDVDFEACLGISGTRAPEPEVTEAQVTSNIDGQTTPILFCFFTDLVHIDSNPATVQLGKELQSLPFLVDRSFIHQQRSQRDQDGSCDVCRCTAIVTSDGNNVIQNEWNVLSIAKGEANCTGCQRKTSRVRWEGTTRRRMPPAKTP